jgi:hypothetical protein
MHASIACLLLYGDYVWVSLGNAMKAKQSKAKQTTWRKVLATRIIMMHSRAKPRACLLLVVDNYVCQWAPLGNAMKAKERKVAKHIKPRARITKPRT